VIVGAYGTQVYLMENKPAFIKLKLFLEIKGIFAVIEDARRLAKFAHDGLIFIIIDWSRI